MSTQRRRVLEGSKLVIPADGVYIEGLDRKAYTVDEWQSGDAANSIIVASGDAKFRIALTQAPSDMQIGLDKGDYPEDYMTGTTSSATALSDYDGAGNTANILRMQPSTDYAAGYCDAFVFPDGKTKGFLPSLGQLNLANQNASDVNAALNKCGGTVMSLHHWSSTFFDGDSYWLLIFEYGDITAGYSHYSYSVRPFADLE